MGVMVEHEYDAFVLHNAEGKDLAFVQEMASILEGPKYNFRLFLPWRDLQATEQRSTIYTALTEQFLNQITKS
jgi:hypothetical protein